MLQDTIQYYIKNKKIKETDLIITSVIEETISDNSLALIAINKISSSISLNALSLLSFKHTDEYKIIQTEIFIKGQLEYVNKNNELKLYKFSLLKHLLLKVSITEHIKLAPSDIYIHDIICRKTDESSFYVAMLLDFNINTL